MDVTGLEKVRARGGSYYFEDSKGEIKAKICRTCEEVVPIEDYRVDKRGLGGRVAKCTPCRNKEVRDYKRANPDIIREQYRKYYKENRDDIRARAKESRERNKEHYLEYYRNYYRENRSTVLEHKRKWRERNQEYQNQLVKDWEKRNPERVTLIDQRRRARELSQPDTFTSEEMVQTLKYFGESCALTGSKEEIHWDHVIPLSVGNVGTVKGNMIPLDAELNRRKSNLNIFEWFERSKVELGLSEEKFNILIDFLASENGMTKEEYRSFCYAQFEIKGEVI